MAKRKGDNRSPLCRMDGCMAEAEMKESGLCKNCYNYMRRWMRRTPTEVLDRQAQITVWSNRLDSLTPVASAPAKRRKRARR